MSIVKSLNVFLLVSFIVLAGCQKIGINGDLSSNGNAPYSQPPSGNLGGVIPGCPSDAPSCPSGDGTCAYATWQDSSIGDPNVGAILFNIYYGKNSGVYDSQVNAIDGTCYQFTGMSPGTYYFVVTAYNSNWESSYSNEATKSILLPQLINNPHVKVSSQGSFVVSGPSSF
jgi:hypothetical protein